SAGATHRGDGRTQAVRHQHAAIDDAHQRAAVQHRECPVRLPLAAEVASSGSRALVSCVRPKAKIVAVSGARITPPSVAAMHTSGHSIGSLPGSTWAKPTPRPAPIMSSGASTPPEV